MQRRRDRTLTPARTSRIYLKLTYCEALLAVLVGEGTWTVDSRVPVLITLTTVELPSTTSLDEKVVVKTLMSVEMENPSIEDVAMSASARAVCL